MERGVLDSIKSDLDDGWICSSVTKRGKTKSGNIMHNLTFGSAKSRFICQKILPYLRIKQENTLKVINWKKKIHALAAEARDEFPEVCRLYKEGYSLLEVSQITGIHVSTVGYWLRNHGLTRTYKESQIIRRQREKST